MNEYPLHKFIDLVSFDQSIIGLEKEVETLNQKIAKAQQEIAIYEQDIKQSKEHKNALRKEVDAKELAMQELDEQERDKKNRLDSASNQKEYQSLKNELEALKKSQKTLEDQLIAAWKAFESYTNTFDEKAKFCQEKLNALNSTIADLMKKREELQGKIKELIDSRSKKEEGIPQEWLEHYAAMRTKVSNPVVPIANTSCSACFYTISQRDLVELRRGVLLRCRDCFRFLYLPRDKQTLSNEGA